MLGLYVPPRRSRNDSLSRVCIIVVRARSLSRSSGVKEHVPVKKKLVVAFASVPLLTTFFMTPVGGLMPGSRGSSIRPPAGSDASQVSTKGFNATVSTLPTRMNVKSLASANLSL